MPQSRYNSRGCPPPPVLVHPPFPSFAWVMTAQANPPTDAYAYGYAQNARTHSRALTQRQTCLPGSYTAHHECYQPYSRTAKPLFPPSPAPASAAEVSSIVTHEMFMQTVDHRYHDPPTRPFVPWRASLAACEMQRLRPSVPVPAESSSRAKGFTPGFASCMWPPQRQQARPSPYCMIDSMSTNGN